jgi:SRSO17 transposase
MQDVLARMRWDDAAVRTDVREFVARELGDADAVMVIDETGDLKKGRNTVGVQRQYSGTAGKIENCQLAVHLIYATEMAHAMLDTALYLPKSWCDDPERRAEAGVPKQVRFATMPHLAARMIETAVTAGLPCRWVAGDEAYGGDLRLAARLRLLRLGYVLAVARSHQVSTGLHPPNAIAVSDTIVVITVYAAMSSVWPWCAQKPGIATFITPFSRLAADAMNKLVRFPESRTTERLITALRP